jgi:hypothetical protein
LAATVRFCAVACLVSVAAAGGAAIRAIIGFFAGSAADDDARISTATTPIAAPTVFSNFVITHLP